MQPVHPFSPKALRSLFPNLPAQLRVRDVPGLRGLRGGNIYRHPLTVAHRGWYTSTPVILTPGYSTTANGWADDIRLEAGEGCVLLRHGDEYSFNFYVVGEVRALCAYLAFWAADQAAIGEYLSERVYREQGLAAAKAVWVAHLAALPDCYALDDELTRRTAEVEVAAGLDPNGQGGGQNKVTLELLRDWVRPSREFIRQVSSGRVPLDMSVALDVLAKMQAARRHASGANYVYCDHALCTARTWFNAGYQNRMRLPLYNPSPTNPAPFRDEIRAFWGEDDTTGHSGEALVAPVDVAPVNVAPAGVE